MPSVIQQTATRDPAQAEARPRWGVHQPRFARSSHSRQTTKESVPARSTLAMLSSASRRAPVNRFGVRRVLRGRAGAGFDLTRAQVVPRGSLENERPDSSFELLDAP